MIPLRDVDGKNAVCSTDALLAKTIPAMARRRQKGGCVATSALLAKMIPLRDVDGKNAVCGYKCPACQERT
jgi:hypothetical protein